LKKNLSSVIWLLVAEVCLIPVYAVMATGLIFNDSGYQADTFMDFLFSVWFIFVILLTAFVFAYVLLRKLKCNKKLLHFFYIPTRLLLFGFIFCLFMQVYMNPKVDEKINPLTIYTKQSKEKIMKKSFEEYQEKKEQYENLYSFKTDRENFSFLMNKNTNELFVLIEKDQETYFKNLPKVKYSEIKKGSKIRDINITSPLSLKLIENQYGAYVAIPSKNLAYEIPSNERMVRENLKNNLISYVVRYKDGSVYRTGDIGEDVCWVFKRDEKQILSRSAKSETVLDLTAIPDLFGPKGNYSVYVETCSFTKSSNVAKWTIY